MADERWTDSMDELLSTLGVHDPTTRAVVLRELRAALQGEHPPQVQVLPGGRMHDDDIRLDDHDDDIPHLEVVDGEGLSDPGPDVSVRVVRATLPSPVDAPDLTVGHLRLADDEDVWQTILHATEPSAYRIHCDTGELHVAADGDLVARIEAGQSTDVEASVLRVRACSEDGARGRFTRIP